MKWKSDQGFTLVEVLAALTILGIIFVSFMTIFPQMTKQNLRTEAKLETMNLAKRELILWEKDPRPLVDIYDLEMITPSASKSGNIIYEYRYKEEPLFIYRVTYKTNPDLPISHKGKIELHRVHIAVFKDKREISETFGYMKKTSE